MVNLRLSFFEVFEVEVWSLNGNVFGCVFAKNRPVSLNWSDYSPGSTQEDPPLFNWKIADGT